MENGQHKKYIFVCTGSDCKDNGSKKLEKAIANEVKDAKLRSFVDVIKTKCMGHCKKGPNVIVEDCLYHRVKEKDIEEVLSKTKFSLEEPF